MNCIDKGDSELLKLIKEQPFNFEKAENIISGIEINKPIQDELGFSSTYLYEAVDENNLAAVEFFLSHGANPNLNIPELICDCALWELQYIYENQDADTRFQICKLFFKYGADPNITCDNETLYDYVSFKVYNYSDMCVDAEEFDYLCRFYLLLVLYDGGKKGDEYRKPALKNINFDKIDEYDIQFFYDKDNYGITGALIDENGEIIAEL